MLDTIGTTRRSNFARWTFTTCYFLTGRFVAVMLRLNAFPDMCLTLDYSGLHVNGEFWVHRYTLGELSFGLVVVHPVAGDGSQLPAPVVLVVDVVGDVLQVLHVSPGRKAQMLNVRRITLFNRVTVITPKWYSDHTYSTVYTYTWQDSSVETHGSR